MNDDPAVNPTELVLLIEMLTDSIEYSRLEYERFSREVDDVTDEQLDLLETNLKAKEKLRDKILNDVHVVFRPREILLAAGYDDLDPADQKLVDEIRERWPHDLGKQNTAFITLGLMEDKNRKFKWRPTPS